MELYLIPDAYCLHFEDIIWSAGSKYKQLVDADKWTPVPGSATLDAELTLPAGYQAAPPTEPVVFHTNMCQAISNDVASAISASIQDTPPPPKVGIGRGGRGVRGGNPKQVSVPGNCNRCGKAGQYVQDCPERNTYWDPPPAGTEYAATKMHRKKGYK